MFNSVFVGPESVKRLNLKATAYSVTAFWTEPDIKNGVIQKYLLIASSDGIAITTVVVSMLSLLRYS